MTDQKIIGNQSIKIRPISINEAYTGKRFKTDAYRAYCKELTFSLKPKLKQIDKGARLELIIEFGLSTDACDWDNPVKPFQDVLSKKYGFNDKAIKRGRVNIEVVGPGNEYIYFELKEIQP